MDDIIQNLRTLGRTNKAAEYIASAAADEIERLRAALQAYLDYCAPEDKWQGDPVLLRIRRQMRAALGDEQKGGSG